MPGPGESGPPQSVPGPGESAPPQSVLGRHKKSSFRLYGDTPGKCRELSETPWKLVINKSHHEFLISRPLYCPGLRSFLTPPRADFRPPLWGFQSQRDGTM